MDVYRCRNYGTDRSRTIKKYVTGVVFVRSRNACVCTAEPCMLLDLVTFAMLPLTRAPIGKLALFDALSRIRTVPRVTHGYGLFAKLRETIEFLHNPCEIIPRPFK